MKLRHAAALAAIATLTAGCGSQAASTKAATDFGCKVDTMQICQMAIREHNLMGLNEQDVLDSTQQLAHYDRRLPCRAELCVKRLAEKSFIG
jgi:hypothetical protein